MFQMNKFNEIPTIYIQANSNGYILAFNEPNIKCIKFSLEIEIVKSK